tara:strand:- start:235 stop:435 length:201 start_codon:yes stop_codon:yes gene_type:complete
MQSGVQRLQKVIEGVACTTIVTFVEERVLLLVNVSSGLIFSFVGITTYRTSKIPKIISNLLELFDP